MTSEEHAVVEAMTKYGGNFVQHLAKAMLAADPTNFMTLKQAFPEYWVKYAAFANKGKENGPA